MSIRTKVALALALAASVAALVVASVAYRSTSDRLLAEVDRSLDQAVAGALIRPGDRLPDRGPLSDFAAQIIGPQGSVVQSTFPEPIPPDADRLDRARADRGGALSTLESAGTDFRVKTLPAGRSFVEVGRPLDETQRVLAALRLRLLLVGLAVAAVAGAVGWWIASRLTVPLRRLTATAERIGTTGDIDDDAVEEVGAAVGVDSNESGETHHSGEGADEVARLSGAFATMVRALARSRSEQRRLVQDAGHELRTPLTSLRTNLDTLRRHPELDGDDRDAIIADLHAETDELTALVNEVIAAASGELDREAATVVVLDEVAGQIAERAARRFEREVEVVGVKGEQATLHAHAAGVQRAISCLVDNAAKFDPSGALITIELAEVAGPDGDRRVFVTVLDRGPGIDPVDRDAVFERFGRAESSRATDGSGLGLAIVAEVARRHGGGVVATDRPDGGAAVGFWLPAG